MVEASLIFILCILLVSSAAINSKRLIVGVNKYSHDSSICIIDALEEKVLFTQAKERITGRKHDGGAVGGLMKYALDYIGANADDIHTVVSNNHHFRVLPFEKRIPWAVATKAVPADYADTLNLLAGAKHLELSHHLAHAWSMVGSAPFSEGLVVVMDGMGESYRAMREDITSIEGNSGDYMHDLKLLKAYGGEGFVGIPTILNPSSGYREAESAYIFDGSSLRPVFKRWTREQSPSELFNHGFENMESLGAVYSRISSHILGDWNACGKVMGLTSWNSKHFKETDKWIFGKDKPSTLNLGKDFYHKYDLMKGNPYIEGDFFINWDVIESIPEPNVFNANNFGRSAVLASSVQMDLEASALSLVDSLRSVTQQQNLALAGGVALNSVMNGRIVKESGFDNVFISPSPGDEGIAVGCAMYGLQRFREEEQFKKNGESSVSIKQVAFSAYQGADFSEDAIVDAISEHSGWLEVRRLDEDALIETAAETIADGRVIAWFQGRSEFGQRALGSRSLLADPRIEELRRTMNEEVKEREWWRPLAPSVLSEHVREWFDVSDKNLSPYMSLTCAVKDEKRELVPAICHIDGTARLQTISEAENSLYHKLISAFFRLTKVPMVMNTSFNRKSQPIVETPAQAIDTLLSSGGSVDSLFMGNFQIRRKSFPREELLKNPTQLELPVYAVPIYIAEVTSSMQEPDEPVRIRVQDGRGDQEWGRNDFPSALHLEVLQALQNSAESDGEYDTTGVCDLYAAFTDGLEVPWLQVVDALDWLFCNCYVYFDDATEDVDPAEALKGLADIVDLRGE